ncbi:hypothetical protein JXA56_00155 [Candidatus Micrarchaeota archaeon]|nr:hypothetical protein [Candidatus Micrarchaeota archaeon]
MKNWFVLLALFIGMLLAGCVGDGSSFGESETLRETDGATVVGQSIQNTAGTTAPLVEVIHFHGTHQCYSCITMGQYAEETIRTYFSKEVEEGKLSFAHINGELPENQVKVAKYGVTGSSLFIGVYSGEGFRKEENVMVWYKIGNKEEYMKYLKGVLEKKLQEV